MKSIIILSIVLVAVIWIFAIGQLALAKHHDSDKAQATTSDQPKASDDELGKTTDVDVSQLPPGQIVPGETATNTLAAKTNCSNGSDKNNDAICTPEQLKEMTDDAAAATKQTVDTPLSTPTPTQTPTSNTEPSNTNTIDQQNQKVIGDLIAAGQQSESSGSSSTSSSGGSDSDESEDKQVKEENNNLGADTHFVLMQSFPIENRLHSKIGLYSIVSDENELDTSILPKTLRPIEQFNTAAEALSWLNDYDSSIEK